MKNSWRDSLGSALGRVWLGVGLGLLSRPLLAKAFYLNLTGIMSSSIMPSLGSSV